MIRLLLIGTAIATTAIGCGTLVTEPAGERSFLPDRGIGPWRIADFEVCQGEVCGEEIWSEITSIDLAHDGVDFIAVAGWRDGHITAGSLARSGDGWRVDFEALEALSASSTIPWQAGGLLDPDIVAARDGTGAEIILLGAADGSAIGYARRQAGAWALDPQPLVRANDIGATSVRHPTGLVYDGIALLGFTAVGPVGGDDRIMIARSSDADFANIAGIATAEVTLTLADIDSSKLATVDPDSDVPPRGWGPLSKLSHPDLGVTPDGLLRIFFAATGPIAFGNGIEPIESNASIGYAAATGLTSPLSFAPYERNPVYNRSFSFIFHADERAPSVAGDGDILLLVYMESRPAYRAVPVIAEHKLGQ